MNRGADDYGKYVHLMLLCCTMLYYALQVAVLALSSLAKPHQPNGHNDQIALVDPLEEYELDTPTTLGHPWHGPDLGPAYDHNHNHDHGPDSHSFSSHEFNLGPQHFMHSVYSSTT